MTDLTDRALQRMIMRFVTEFMGLEKGFEVVWWWVLGVVIWLV